MNRLTSLGLQLLFIGTTALLPSCGKDEPKLEYDEILEYSKFKEYYNALFNTSWKVEEMRSWRYENGRWTDLYDELQTNLDDFGVDKMIITFTNKRNPNKCNLELICNLQPYADERAWWIYTTYHGSDYDKEYLNLPYLACVYNGYINDEYKCMNVPYGPITELTPNRIVMDYTYGSTSRFRKRAVLTKVATPLQNNNPSSK